MPRPVHAPSGNVVCALVTVFAVLLVVWQVFAAMRNIPSAVPPWWLVLSAAKRMMCAAPYQPWVNWGAVRKGRPAVTPLILESWVAVD